MKHFLRSIALIGIAVFLIWPDATNDPTPESLCNLKADEGLTAQVDCPYPIDRELRQYRLDQRFELRNMA